MQAGLRGIVSIAEGSVKGLLRNGAILHREARDWGAGERPLQTTAFSGKDVVQHGGNEGSRRGMEGHGGRRFQRGGRGDEKGEVVAVFAGKGTLTLNPSPGGEREAVKEREATVEGGCRFCRDSPTETSGTRLPFLPEVGNLTSSKRNRRRPYIAPREHTKRGDAGCRFCRNPRFMSQRGWVRLFRCAAKGWYARHTPNATREASGRLFCSVVYAMGAAPAPVRYGQERTVS